MKKAKKFNFTIDNPWSIFFLFAIVNSIIALYHPAPFMFPDEFGVISIGNWMRGGPEWHFRPTMYYGYTFSPFVAIMLSLSDHIGVVYRGSLIIKSLQISLVPFFSYKILKEVLNVEKPAVRVLIPIAIGLYPSFMLFSKLSSNDTSLHFTLFILFYLFGKCAVWQKGIASCAEGSGFFERAQVFAKNNWVLWLYSVLLGFFAVFAYASHGIGLAFIVATLMTAIAAHIFTKRKLVSYIPFLASMGLFFLIDLRLKAIVSDAVFSLRGDGTMANTVEDGLNRMMGYVVNPGRMIYFFRIVIARIYYSTAASFGFFMLGIVILLVFCVGFVYATYSKKYPVEKKPMLVPEERALFILALFGFIIVACVVGLTSMYNVSAAIHRGGRFWFYGRYHAFASLPIVILGLYCVMYKGIVWKKLFKYGIITIGVTLALTLYVQFFVIEHASTGGVNILFIPDILPFLGNSIAEIHDGGRAHNLAVLSFVVFIVFGLSMVLMRNEKQRIFVVVGIAAMFAYGSHFAIMASINRSSNASYNNFFAAWREPRRELDAFSDLYYRFPNLYVVSTRLGPDTASRNLQQSRAQLNFVNYSTAGFRPEAWPNARAENTLIISDRNLEEIGPEAMLIHESYRTYIWIRGDEIIAYYLNNFNGNAGAY